MSFQSEIVDDNLSTLILKSYFLSTLSYFLKNKENKEKNDEDGELTHLPNISPIPQELLYPYLSTIYAGLLPNWSPALHNTAIFQGMLPSLPAFPSSLVATPSTSQHSAPSPEPVSSYYDCDERSSSPLNLSKSCDSGAPSPAPSEQANSDPETSFSTSCYYLSRPGRRKRVDLETASPETRERKIKERREANAARERMRNKNMKQAYSWLKACLNLPPTAKQFVTLYKALETLVKCTCRSVTKLGSLKSPPLDQAAYLARLNKLLLQAKWESSTPTQHSRWKEHAFQSLEEKEKERRHANAQRERKRVKELVNVMRELGRICQSYLDHKGHLGPRTYLETLHMTADIVAACTCKEEEENKAQSFQFKVEEYSDDVEEAFLGEEEN